MKTNIVKAITKTASVLMLCIAAVNSRAFTGEEGKVDYHKVAASPSFWIALVLFIGFVTAGIMVGRKDRSASAK